MSSQRHAAGRQQKRHRNACGAVIAFHACAASVLVLTGRHQNFVGWFRASSSLPSLRTSGQQLSEASALTRAALPWEVTERPGLPESPDEMVSQAANAVMRAYRDGVTRQAVRLRLDWMYDMESIPSKGFESLLNASLPAVELFTGFLWGGDYLKDIKKSYLDEDSGPVLYREATNELQDAAVHYLPGRDAVVNKQVRAFYEQMEDRLVVLLNTEESASAFAVENKGRDFLDFPEAGKEVSKDFEEQPYYYFRGPFAQWLMTTYRNYPYPWEIYIETLDYETIKIYESDKKPSFETIIFILTKYEEKNGISPMKKVGKMVRDTQKQEEVSEEQQPGWRAGSPQGILDLAEKNMEGQKLAEANAAKAAESVEKEG
eukprot:TRINITY_DN115266_c0_g1_i1.p1 TRINITY_DN115266_c0_g1~~TRINITY_DN115266_c0_g1_i1.p1  ORF type:complete len:374 (+),score=116.93 TRINITY_DN115266_c0_g1_i1:106-1227(+)